jgi:hypothetical protein
MGEFMTATPGENWGLVNRPAGMAAGCLIKRITGAAALPTALITPHAIQTLMSQSVLNIAMWFVSFVFAIGCGTTRCG